MVGMVWEGRREGWEGQQGDGDVSCLERYRTNVILAHRTKVRC
jgi:hypothetical protein